MKDLYVTLKAIKLLEKNVGEMPLDLGLGKKFMATSLKSQATKTKINKSDFIKLKVFYTAKGTMNRVKRQLVGWEETFANYSSNKALISGM